MTLTIYTNFSKRNNSTKQPVSAGTSHTVYMKDQTSVLHPVFLIDGVDLAATYCEWNGRYYFIDDIVLQNNNIYELHCTFDALATWKSTIGSSTQYVLRASSDYNGDITDTFYPAKKDPTCVTIDASPGPSWASSMDAGYYVIGIISKNNTGTIGTVNQGAVRYYMMSPSDLATFGSKLYDPSSYTNWTDAYKYSFNPIQFISSIKWFPIAPPNSGTLGVFLPVGWEDMAQTYSHLTAGYSESTFQFSFTRHPQAATRGSYLNSGPYSDYTLVFPPFGEIGLDPDQVALVTIMNVIMKVDFITGKATLIGRAVVGLDTVIELFRREIMLGVNVQIAQITQNAIAQAQNAISTTAGVVGAALSGNIGGAIASAASGIVSAYELKFPKAQSTGTNDSVIGVLGGQVDPKLFERFYEIVDEDNATCGRPLCEARTISSLSGYMMCANAEIEIPGLPEERDAIVSFMNGGFFYE